MIERLAGAPRLMACLLYGAGLRVLECCRLRVQDIDFGSGQIVVRSGKGHWPHDPQSVLARADDVVQ